MFGLFRKKMPGAVEKFAVYKTKVEKYRQLILDLQQLLSEKKKLSLIYFKRETKEELEKLLNVVSIDYIEDQRSLEKENQILLNSFEYSVKHPLDSSYIVIAAETHSYRSENLQLAQSLKDHSFITLFTSLDEHVFKAFGSKRILDIMNMFGLKENEKIEHSLVTKSIINAQEKLEEKERGR